MSAADPTALAESLDRAIDEMLTVRLALSGTPAAMPEIALDAVLRDDADYRRARLTFREALDALLDVADEGLRDRVLDLESQANSLVAQAAEVAWRLATTVARKDGARWA